MGFWLSARSNCHRGLIHIFSGHQVDPRLFRAQLPVRRTTCGCVGQRGHGADDPQLGGVVQGGQTTNSGPFFQRFSAGIPTADPAPVRVNAEPALPRPIMRLMRPMTEDGPPWWGSGMHSTGKQRPIRPVQQMQMQGAGARARYQSRPWWAVQARCIAAALQPGPVARSRLVLHAVARQASCPRQEHGACAPGGLALHHICRTPTERRAPRSPIQYFQ